MDEKTLKKLEKLSVMFDGEGDYLKVDLFIETLKKFSENIKSDLEENSKYTEKVDFEMKSLVNEIYSDLKSIKKDYSLKIEDKESGLKEKINTVQSKVSAITKQINTIFDKIDEISALEIKDGKDADEEKIKSEIFTKLLKAIDENKEVLTGEDIVDRINLLDESEENKIDAKYIKNLPTINKGGVGITSIRMASDVRADNPQSGQTLVWDSASQNFILANTASTDEKVKVDASGTAGYLFDKLSAGTDVSLTKVGDKVEISTTPQIISFDDINGLPSDNTALASEISDIYLAIDDQAGRIDDIIGVDLPGKQDSLVSSVNIKTINGSSILGSGDLNISGGDPLNTITIVSSDITLSSEEIIKVESYPDPTEITLPDASSYVGKKYIIYAVLNNVVGGITINSGASGINYGSPNIIYEIPLLSDEIDVSNTYCLISDGISWIPFSAPININQKLASYQKKSEKNQPGGYIGLESLSSIRVSNYFDTDPINNSTGIHRKLGSPSSLDDNTLGYEINDLWVSPDGLWICTNNTTDESIWIKSAENYSPKKGIVEVDFGINLSSKAISTVLNNLVSQTNPPIVSMYAIDTANNLAENCIVENLTAYVSNIVDNTSFDVIVSAPNLTTGIYKVIYNI